MTDSVELPNNGQSAPFENNQPQQQAPQSSPEPEMQPCVTPAPVPENNELSPEPQTTTNETAEEFVPDVETLSAEPESHPEQAPDDNIDEEFPQEKNGDFVQENYVNGHEYHDASHDDYDHQKECEAPDGNSIVVRYGVMQFIGEFRHNFPVAPVIGSRVVVRTERGVELGEVLMPVFRKEEGCNGCVRKITGDHLQKYLNECGPEHPFRRQGKVLRTANQQDVIDFRHLTHSAEEAAKFCRDHIVKFRLNMKLVKVEHLLGGGRIVFYFTAEQRVDFRELVKTLASQFRTRIEMRQVGARDEARLVGDYERCGQRCCCQQFLKNLKPVSMKMAKVQKATLDPSKISGRCGRLMCCLRYEDDGYEELRKRLPRRGIWVKLEDGTIGRVVDTQILTQLVKLELANREFEAVNVDDIIERDIPQPSEQELEDLARKPREKKPVTPIVAPVTYFSAQTMMEIDSQLDESEAAVAVEAEKISVESVAVTNAPAESGEEKRDSHQRRRRHKNNRRPGGGDRKPQQGQDSQTQKPRPETGGDNAPQQQGDKRGKHKRRHRRHNKKPNDGGQSNQQSGNAGGE